MRKVWHVTGLDAVSQKDYFQRLSHAECARNAEKACGALSVCFFCYVMKDLQLRFSDPPSKVMRVSPHDSLSANRCVCFLSVLHLFLFVKIEPALGH